MSVYVVCVAASVVTLYVWPCPRDCARDCMPLCVCGCLSLRSSLGS